MASGNLTLVCSQLRRPSQKGTELKPCPIRHRLPTPAPPSSWPSPLTAPDTSLEWDHTRVVSVRPSRFAWHAVLRVRRGVLRVGAPFPSWVTAPRACRPLPAPTRLPPGARVAAALGCREFRCRERGHTDTSSGPRFTSFWLCAQKWDRWIQCGFSV